MNDVGALLIQGLCDESELADLVDSYKAAATVFVEVLVAVGYTSEKFERRYDGYPIRFG